MCEIPSNVILAREFAELYAVIADRLREAAALLERRSVMVRLRHITFASVLIALLGMAAAATAGERMKHTGSIVSIADDSKSFVLAEVGPWRVRDGATVVTYRTITLAPGTEYAIAARAAAPPSGFPGDFVEILVDPEFVYLHDYVTVDCLHEGARLVALKITVIELPPLGATR